MLKYPHPALRAHDEEVTEFGADLKKTVKEMFLVMYASKGVGLAAPQVHTPSVARAPSVTRAPCRGTMQSHAPPQVLQGTVWATCRAERGLAPGAL